MCICSVQAYGYVIDRWEGWKWQVQGLETNDREQMSYPKRPILTKNKLKKYCNDKYSKRMAK